MRARVLHGKNFHHIKTKETRGKKLFCQRHQKKKRFRFLYENRWLSSMCVSTFRTNIISVWWVFIDSILFICHLFVCFFLSFCFFLYLLPSLLYFIGIINVHKRYSCPVSFPFIYIILASRLCQRWLDVLTLEPSLKIQLFYIV